MHDFSLSGASVLVVEDEPLLRKQIVAYLEKSRAEAVGAGSLAEARRALADCNFDFALLDVNLPDGLGTALLEQKLFAPHTGVVVITARGSVAGAVEAIRLGAADYLAKPFDLTELPLVLGRTQRTRQSARLEEYRRAETDEAGGSFFFGDAMAALSAQLEKILAADNRIHGGRESRIRSHESGVRSQEPGLPPILIQGETGTGKTTIARWLHHRGPRGARALVEVNCSALPEGLAESELFGHERGAFTDARSARIGLFEAADGGSLFLDELPSLSANLQAKVLKAIEENRIRRLGGTKEIPVDVRVIAATHRDLKKLVSEGAFREDLFHRLDLYRVQIPALRERGGDILRLAELLIRRLCERHRLPNKRISAAGRQRLAAYRWPGNVRELAHELERAIVFEDSNELHFENLQTPIDPAAPEADTPWLNPDFHFPPQGFVLEDAIGALIRLALKQTDNNVSAAARLLGVSRDYLRYRLAGKKPEA